MFGAVLIERYSRLYPVIMLLELQIVTTENSYEDDHHAIMPFVVVINLFFRVHKIFESMYSHHVKRVAKKIVFNNDYDRCGEHPDGVILLSTAKWM